MYSSYSFFILDARWWWVVSATPWPLCPSLKTRYPLYRRLGGPLGRSGWVHQILPSSGIWSPHRPAHSEPLYRLNYPGSQQMHNVHIVPPPATSACTRHTPKSPCPCSGAETSASRAGKQTIHDGLYTPAFSILRNDTSLSKQMFGITKHIVC
jgi:hypothetical protein